MATEINKRPWEAKAGDVLLRNPEHPDQHVEWIVTGKPYTDGWYTHVTYSMPAEGGEGVAICQPGQYITVRGGRTYVVEPIYTEQERDDALNALNCGDRAYITGVIRTYFPEVFDQALQRLLAREDRITTASKEEATS